MVSLCYECQRKLNAADDEDERPMWHYRTVNDACEECGVEYSHERIHLETDQ